MAFGIYSAVLTRELLRFSFFDFSERVCVFQGVYSLSYSIGATFVYFMVSGGKKYVGVAIALCGLMIPIIGLYINFQKTGFFFIDDYTVICIYLADIILGFLDGILEPLILNKIVTQSNRPEFFTGLFYFQASLAAVMVISTPK